jgi:hypothetical protein
MTLQQALELSAVEHLLDNDGKKVGARRPYTALNTTAGSAVSPGIRRYLVAYSMDDFHIVWADTMKPTSENLKFYVRDYTAQKYIDTNDWEPL